MYIGLLLLMGISTTLVWGEMVEVETQLLDVQRVHVEKLTGGEAADQIRDMIISCFQRTKLFVLTENPEKADAVLRGSAEDLIYTETHDTREGVDARGTVSIGGSRYGSGRKGIYLNSGVGQDESSRKVERRHEAMAAVRLVNRDGDVIWSTVQESQGAKFHGASRDVAERITKQLLVDFKRVRSPRDRGRPGVVGP